MTTFTATRTVTTGPKHTTRTVTVRDAQGNVTDTRKSKTMDYVEVLLTPEGKINRASQKRGGAGQVVGWHVVPVTEAPAEDPALRMRREASARAKRDATKLPSALHGTEGDPAKGFSAHDILDAAAAAAREDLAEQAAREVLEAAAIVAPVEAPVPAPALSFLPDRAVTDAPKSGAYLRVKVNGKPVGYVSPRKGGAQLVEVLTSRLAKAEASLLEGTSARQNQTALLVTDEATAEQARALFAVAAEAVS